MLQGIRVIDFTQYLPGPHATLRLVELGAEVIKVESPYGDPSRPAAGEKDAGLGLVFKVQNRDKKSVVLNLKNPEDQQTALKLIRDADVVVEGFRPGVVDRMGIGYEDVKKVKEDIIYCSISGYGQIGDMSKMGGHDINYLSLSGVLAQLKDQNGRPIMPSTTIADIISGIAASEAILSAIVKKLKTGEGSYIDLSITDAALSLMSNHITVESVTGEEHGIDKLNNKLICYNLYETKDGRYVSLGALEPKFWSNFCNALNKSHWLKAHISEASEDNPIFEELKSVIKSKTFAEWTEFSQQVDCCMAPVLETSELHQQPLFKERSVIVEKEGTRYFTTRYSPVKDIFSQLDAPELGHHNYEVLSKYDNKFLDLESLSHISLYEMLEISAMKYPRNTAIIDGAIVLTYTQLLALVDCFASQLVLQGFKKGERIGLMLPNGIHYIIAYYATMRLGGVVVQVNPSYQSSELEYIIDDSSPTWFVCHPNHAGKIDKISKFDSINVIYTKTEDGTDQIFTYEKAGELPVIKINPKEDVAVIQYTGGTTGKPKGAMITHFNIISNIHQAGAVFEEVIEKGEERILGIAPLTHAMAMTNMNYTFWNASTYIILEKFDATKVLQLVEQYRLTYFLGSPTMYIALLNHPDLEKYDLSCFKICLSGSAPLPVEVIKRLEEKTGAHILEGYGLSEVTTSSHRSPLDGNRKIGSVGIPIPNTESKIVSLENDSEEVPVGESGELIIRGPQVMKGYWNKPTETAEVIRNGWLYTGDIAQQDEDGYYYIVGRKKDMVIAGGLNIYPAEVEEVFYQHPDIAEVCLFGIPDPYLGEKLVGVVVLKKDATLTEEELLNWCESRIAKYKIPRAIEFREELPKTIVGKILRRKLIEEFINKQKA